MALLKEFREFIMRGNVVDLAVGFTVGAAFTALVQSMVTNLLMSPLGMLVGEIDFTDRFILLQAGEPGPPYATLAAARGAGAVTLNYGVFVDELLSFIVVAAAVFLVVRSLNRWERRRQEAGPSEPSTRQCPFCLSVVPIRASRCPACTSRIGEGGSGGS